MMAHTPSPLAVNASTEILPVNVSYPTTPEDGS